MYNNFHVKQHKNLNKFKYVIIYNLIINIE
jgi:hypothetical protein